MLVLYICLWLLIFDYMLFFFFFFKQKTAYEMRISDWSSDVCSSDLAICAAFSAFSGSPKSASSAPKASRWASPSASRRSTAPKRRSASSRPKHVGRHPPAQADFRAENPIRAGRRRDHTGRPGLPPFTLAPPARTPTHPHPAQRREAQEGGK